MKGERYDQAEQNKPNVLFIIGDDIGGSNFHFTTRRASKHLITLAALLWPTFQCSVDPSHNSRPEW
jgi:arylsulfatase A-like enzyme